MHLDNDKLAVAGHQAGYYKISSLAVAAGLDPARLQGAMRRDLALDSEELATLAQTVGYEVHGLCRRSPERRRQSGASS